MLEITVCDIWIDLPCIYYLVLCTLTVIHWTSGGGGQLLSLCHWQQILWVLWVALWHQNRPVASSRFSVGLKL